MKAHIGVDLDSGLVHTVLTTPAHVNDVTQAHGLLHGQETVAFADAGYQGVDKRPENQGQPVTWHVALRPGVRRALPDDELGPGCVSASSASRRACGRRSSIRFTSSRTCSGTARRDTGVLPRTPPRWSPCLGWPISCWPAGACGRGTP